MSKYKICPVCENKIPEDVLDFCFFCGFSLAKLKDKKEIAKAKFNFSGEKIEFDLWPKLGGKRGPKPLFDLFVGVFVGILFFVIISNARTPFGLWTGSRIFLFCLVFGFLAGIIIYLLHILIYDSFHNFLDRK